MNDKNGRFVEISEKVAFRCSKSFFDNSKARFHCKWALTRYFVPELALWAQTLELLFFGVAVLQSCGCALKISIQLQGKIRAQSFLFQFFSDLSFFP